MLIPESVLSQVINSALSEGASFCEIYAEDQISSLMELKSSQTEYISGRDKGAGIRLFYGNEEFYTHTNSLDEDSLMKALKSLTDFKGPSLNKKELLNQEPLSFSFRQEFPQEFKTDLNKEKTFLQKLDKDLRQSSSLISQCSFYFKKN